MAHTRVVTATAKKKSNAPKKGSIRRMIVEPAANGVSVSTEHHPDEPGMYSEPAAPHVFTGKTAHKQAGKHVADALAPMMGADHAEPDADDAGGASDDDEDDEE